MKTPEPPSMRETKEAPEMMGGFSLGGGHMATSSRANTAFNSRRGLNSQSNQDMDSDEQSHGVATQLNIGTLKPSPQDLVKLGDLGRGACGNVVKALHLPTLRFVAVKQISVFEKGKRHQLVKELTALSAHQDCSNLINLHGAFYNEGCVSMVLKYMDRSSLQEAMGRLGSLDEHLIRHLSRGILLGLQHLHSKKLVHRDIKPGNILVNRKGEVKVADFGVLGVLEHTNDLAKTHVGTMAYMSPERIQGQYAAPADIWSFGMTVYALAMGKDPVSANEGYFGIVRRITEHPPPNLSEEHFSREIRSFLHCCLIKDPSKRWSAEQLLDHPFMNEALYPCGWSFEKTQLGARVEPDMQDLVTVINTLIERLYAPPNPPYKRSLFQLATFQRLADEMDVPPQDIQELFEARYLQYLSQIEQQEVIQAQDEARRRYEEEQEQQQQHYHTDPHDDHHDSDIMDHDPLDHHHHLHDQPHYPIEEEEESYHMSGSGMCAREYRAYDYYDDPHGNSNSHPDLSIQGYGLHESSPHFAHVDDLNAFSDHATPPFHNPSSFPSSQSSHRNNIFSHQYGTSGNQQYGAQNHMW